MKIIIEKDDASGFNLDIDDEAAKLAAYALVTRHGFKVFNEVIAAPGNLHSHARSQCGIDQIIRRLWQKVG